LRVLPGDRELLFLLAQVLIQERDFEKAREAAGRLERDGAPAEMLCYLDAQILFQKERWSEARAQLERLLPQLAGTPELALQADLALGHCYARLGKSERSLAAYRRATSLDPSSAAARAGLGTALAAAGRLDEAIAECRQAVALPAAPSFAWV